LGDLSEPVFVQGDPVIPFRGNSITDAWPRIHFDKTGETAQRLRLRRANVVPEPVATADFVYALDRLVAESTDER
jgi:hypothetical protein